MPAIVPVSCVKLFSELDAVLWQGGNMRNAVPFQAEVVLTLPKENVKLNDLVADWKDEICDQFEGIETTENIEFFAENVETPRSRFLPKSRMIL